MRCARGNCWPSRSLTGQPEVYPSRVKEDFGNALALGARLARHFYYGDFLGGAVTSRMVEFGQHSRRFLDVIQAVFEGSQSYLGLATKIYVGLGAALWDIGTDALRQMLDDASGQAAG